MLDPGLGRLLAEKTRRLLWWPPFLSDSSVRKGEMEISQSLVTATHVRGEWGALTPGSGRGCRQGYNASEWGRSLTQVPCSWFIWSRRATRKQRSGSGPGQRQRARRKPPRYRRARNLDVHPWSWMRFKHPPKEPRNGSRQPSEFHCWLDTAQWQSRSENECTTPQRIVFPFGVRQEARRLREL